MSSAAEQSLDPFLPLEQLREARSIIQAEADALADLAQRLDGEFPRACETLFRCRGSVIVTGMGKAGLIGQKIAATLSSTGTRAFCLHPAEAVHGDLGCLHADDALLALSNSGETEEICRVLPTVQEMQIPIVAITASANSTLGSQADVTIRIGKLREAGLHGLAPSSTTTAMLAIGDALALVLGRMNGLTPQKFAIYHPAGNLGARLRTVGSIMRRGDELRIADQGSTIRDVFVGLSQPGRRSGAVMLVDADGRLSGLFTDSDLARLLERRHDSQLDQPIANVMTAGPLTTHENALLIDIVEILSTNKVSELPVIAPDGKPIGLIDITDVIALMPGDPAE